MRFWVVQRQSDIARIPDSAFLVRINWDDYGFKTTFELYYRDQDYALRKYGRSIRSASLAWGVAATFGGYGYRRNLRLWIVPTFHWAKTMSITWRLMNSAARLVQLSLIRYATQPSILSSSTGR